MFKIFSNKIVSNTFWLLSAQFLAKIIAFGYNIFLARSLGPQVYGLFIFGLTLFGLISAIADFGLARFLTRDLTKRPEIASKFTSQIFTLTGFLSAVVVGFLILMLLIFDNNSIRIFVGGVMLATVFPNSLAQIIVATFTALEKMRYVAIALIFLNLAVALLGIAAILFGKFGLFGVVGGFFLAHFLFLVTLVIFLLREKITLVPTFDFKFWQNALKSALPYAVLTALGLIYFRIDSILLIYLRSETETGFYGASFRFLDAVQFIPIAVSTVLFPTFARLHQNSTLALKKIYLRVITILGLAGILISVFLFLTADFVIDLIYGENFQPSILALKILSFAILFSFVHVPGAYLLIAAEKLLTPVIYLSILTVGFNLIANLIFIPIAGFVAAAVITLLSEMLSFLVFGSLIWFKVFRKND